METIILEADSSPEAAALLDLIRSLGVSPSPLPPIRWGDPSAYDSTLPAPWADRPSLDKAKLREIAWGHRR